MKIEPLEQPPLPLEPPKPGFLPELLMSSALTADKTSLNFTHFTACLIFLAIVVAATVAIITQSHWPFTISISGILGLGSIKRKYSTRC